MDHTLRQLDGLKDAPAGVPLWLFIDVQRKFVARAGETAPVPEREEACARIAAVLPFARAAGHNVAWVNMIQPHEKPDDPGHGFFPAGQDRLRDIFGLKASVSGMASGDLPEILHGLKPTALLVGGFLYNRCVFETALAVCRRPEWDGMAVNILSDCTRGTLISSHESAHLRGVMNYNRIGLAPAADYLPAGVAAMEFRPPGHAP